MILYAVMPMIEKDELKLYRGKDCEIDEHIAIHTPSIGEICEYGEKEYFCMVGNLCAVGIDLCWQLEDAGIKFDEIDDFSLFALILSRFYDKSRTKILFGELLDFQEMEPCMDTETDKLIMVQHVKKNSSHTKWQKLKNWCKKKFRNQYEDDIYDIIIDEDTYLKIVTHLRNIHGMARNNAVAGNNAAREAFLFDAREDYLYNTDKPYKSSLLPLVSTMVNIEGFKRNDNEVWDMNLYAFMDSVKRIGKIRNATLLLQSGYSGFGIDLKKLKNKNEVLNFMGELD